MPINNLWHRHPGVRSGEQLTVGERELVASDYQTNVDAGHPVADVHRLVEEIHAAVVPDGSPGR